MIERTLVILKPDAVKRSLIGRVMSRLEDVGLKIVAAKMVKVTPEFAQQHYADLAQRRGDKVATMMIQFLVSGPVFALAVDGVDAVENVRKLVGATEPKAALPGTIRGDFSHVSFSHADKENRAIENLIHASGSSDDAQREIALWFTAKEIHTYKTAQEDHVF